MLTYYNLFISLGNICSLPGTVLGINYMMTSLSFSIFIICSIIFKATMVLNHFILKLH